MENVKVISMAWQKRMSAPLAGRRKSSGKFTASPRGPHAKSASIPLVAALRDIAMLAESGREGKREIKRGEALVDGKVCSDQKFGIGLMDAVAIPSASAAYRVLPEKKGLKLLKIEGKESKMKLCKIVGKTAISGGKIQYNLHDGRNLVSEKEFKTNDSLLIGLPEQEIIEHLKLEEGAAALVTKGKNAGMVARVEKIEAGNMKRIWLKKNSEVFETAFDYVMAVGKDKPALAVE